MKKRGNAFITGIAGFAGSFLAEELLNAGYKVSGSMLRNETTKNIDAISGDLNLVRLDITNPKRTLEILRKLKPDVVFHLAAIASVGHSLSNESETFDVNFHGTLNMIEASRHSGKVKKFLLISSADCYGLFKPNGKTLVESQPLNPISPYGISKTAAEHALRYYYRQHRFPGLIARSFNHSGPRQTENFVIPSFSRQIALIEQGKKRPLLKVGDLSARRDFSDVRDIVAGYRALIERGEVGEAYQLCSGKAVAIQTVLNTLLSKAEKKIKVQVDRSRLRKSDIPILRGSFQKAAKAVGFQPRYTLSETINDTLDYWRHEVAKS